jgi:hypothetical protein
MLVRSACQGDTRAAGCGRVVDPDGLVWAIACFSAGRLTASTPERLSAATTLVEWIGVAQTFLGIALLGLFGFVLGTSSGTHSPAPAVERRRSSNRWL